MGFKGATNLGTLIQVATQSVASEVRGFLKAKGEFAYVIHKEFKLVLVTES